MKLTANERRALAEFQNSEPDWDKVHGRTLHALIHKGLIEGRGKIGGWRLTEAGRDELIVPDVFADLFPSACEHPSHRRGSRGGLASNQEICMTCGAIVLKKRARR